MNDSLLPALDPRSVAIIGASDDPNRIGGRPIHFMLRHGFRGRILPVNPKRPLVQGLPAFESIDALPEVPDLAVIAVSGEATVAAVEACARRGVGVAVVIASGFGETGDEGRRVQQQMVATARAAGMRLVGPNTQGIANFGNGAIANFSTMFAELPPLDGPVAICSQSGGMSQLVYGLVRGRGTGVRYVVATGNEADATVADFALACLGDPEVRLLLLYLEAIADPAQLARAAAVARERGVPIVALKAGRSAGGQRAANAHTGAQANDDRLVDAFFRRHGIWRARDPYSLALAADAYLQGWAPGGRRLVVVSNSGASCVLAADQAEALGLALAELAPETQATVAARLPGFATSRNPIDITAALLQNNRLFGDVLPIVAQDQAADLFFIDIPVAGAGYDVDSFVRDTAAFVRATGKPVAVAAAQQSIADAFRSAGVLCYPDGTDALAVLAQLTQHAQMLREPQAVWPEPEPPDLPDDTGPGLLEREAGLALLRRRGAAIVDDDVRRAGDEAPVRHEFFVGGRVDPMFGPVVRIGDGGRYADALGESVTLLPPFDADEVVRALLGLRIGRMPAGSSGVPATGESVLTLQAIAQLGVDVGRLLRDAGGRIASVELDPVVPGADGRSVRIGDARIETRSLAQAGSEARRDQGELRR